MKKNFDIKYLALAAASFAVVYGLMAGTIQRVIYFEDPLNEMGMAFIAMVLGVGSLFAAFEKSEK